MLNQIQINLNPSVYGLQCYIKNPKCRIKAIITSTPQGFDISLRLMNLSEEVKLEKEEHAEINYFLDVLIDVVTKRLEATIKKLTALLLVDSEAAIWLMDFLECSIETNKAMAKSYLVHKKIETRERVLRTPSITKEPKYFKVKRLKNVTKNERSNKTTLDLGKEGVLNKKNIVDLITIECSKTITESKCIQTDSFGLSIQKGTSRTPEDQKMMRNNSSKKCGRRKSLNLGIAEKKPRSYRDPITFNLDQYPALYLNPMLSSVFNGDEKKTSSNAIQANRVLVSMSRMHVKCLKDSNERNRYILHTKTS